MNLCAKCNNRKTCTKLCAAAKAYVSQDYVPMYEFIHSTVEDNENVYHEDGFNCGYDTFYSSSYENSKYTTIMLYKDGRSIEDINYHINLPEKEIKRIIRRYRMNYKKYNERYTDLAIINM